MKKIKTCLQKIGKQYPNKNLKNIILINNPWPSSFLFKTNFTFSEIPNSKNKAYNNKNLLNDDNVTKGKNFDNLIKIRRHEKKSDYSKDQFNRIKIDPNDEIFYGNYYN